VNVTAGTLSDIYGRRKLLLVSGFFFATSPFLYLPIGKPWQLIPVRVYHGVATAIFTPVALAAIADTYAEKRGEMMGYFSSATLVGRLIAPSMAGTMITLYAFKGAYIVCGILGVASLLILLWMPEVESSRASRKRAPLLRILSDTRIIIGGGVMALTYFVMQSIETFLPLYLSRLKVEAWLIGLLLTLELAVLMVLKPYGGRLYDRLGGYKIITTGAVIAAIGVSAIAFSTAYLAVAIFISLFAVGAALITASVPPLISTLAGEEAHGMALGAMETIKDVGQALGPIASGLIIAYTSYQDMFLVLAGIALIVIPLNLVLHK